jgi:hypothetical protein
MVIACKKYAEKAAALVLRTDDVEFRVDRVNSRIAAGSFGEAVGTQ